MHSLSSGHPKYTGTKTSTPSRESSDKRILNISESTIYMHSLSSGHPKYTGTKTSSPSRESSDKRTLIISESTIYMHSLSSGHLKYTGTKKTLTPRREGLLLYLTTRKMTKTPSRFLMNISVRTHACTKIGRYVMTVESVILQNGL